MIIFYNVKYLVCRKIKFLLIKDVLNIGELFFDVKIDRHKRKLYNRVLF